MLKINAGIETATIVEQTRRAMNDLKSSVKRIASGVAIESAGDDPGGIGSVIYTETAISGVQRTLRNLNEGITVTQALTSDLSLVEDLLLSLREVAEQAASDQFTDLQRAELQDNAQSILRKVDIAVKMAGDDYGLDLTQNSSLSVQGSPDLNLNTQIVLTDLLVEELGKRAIYTSQRNGVFTSPLVNGSLIINEVAIRPTTNDDDTISTSGNDGSAIAKALAINTATYLTGVTAEAGPTSITGNRSVSAVELTGLNYFILNGSVINGISVGDFDSQFQSLQKAINTETQFTGVTAAVDADGRLVLTAEDGRNISIKYSNQEVLNAVGVTDKEGDLANLFGALALGNPDRRLQGEVQIPLTTDFQSYGGNVSVGGRFDASEDYVDFVAHVTKGGGFGVAEMRLDRDPTSEVTPVEDFAFIEGTVDPTVDISSVLGNFFTLNGGTGSVIAGGDYNEGLDRDYIITATKAGTTDGTERAEFQVSTVEDGIVGTFTASANTDILIAGARTGEDVFVRFSSSPRQSTLSSTLAAGHAHDTAVTLGGTYTGLVDSTTTVEVLSSGRTQGTPQAMVQIYHDGLAFGGVTTVNGNTPIDIGNGQNLKIATDIPQYSGVIVSKAGTYGEPVTVDSDPLDFTGIGNGTYSVRITKAGLIGQAEYAVDKIDTSNNTTEIESARVLNSGTVLVSDGVTFNFPDAPPNIGSTTISTSHSEDEIDHYQDYSGAQFTGVYDGARDDTTLIVRVKREGIVLGAAESDLGRTDYALLEYRFGGGAFTGDLVAREGEIVIDNGVKFTLPAASSVTTLVDPSNINNDFGNTASIDGSSVGYDGNISFGFNPSAHQFAEDVSVLFTAVTPVEVVLSGFPPTGDILTVKVVGDSGTVYNTTTIQPVSGDTYTIADGLDVTFNNNSGTSRPNPSINALTDERVLQTNVHSLQVLDEFSVGLGAPKFAIGDTYSVQVDSAHLQSGTLYTIENLLGKYELNDQLIVDADHEFKTPTYILGESVTLLNGLTLDFDQDGGFEIGDEVRFQVRGYTGDPVASGTYSYAISPTTFTVEVTDTGDVDGAAQFKYTRADTGETVAGLTASSSPTLLDDDVRIAFSAGRVYAGDQFFIDTFESLDQTFGGKLTLSSTNTMTIELADSDTDNFIGRVTYTGDTPKAPGNDDNLTSAFLALNDQTAVGQIDLTTQPNAELAVSYTGNAQDSLESYQRRISLTQAELETLSNRLEGVLTQQTELLQKKLKVDVSTESSRSISAITQLASSAMLASVDQQTNQQSLDILQQSLVPITLPEPSSTHKHRSESVEHHQRDKNESTIDRFEEQREKKQESAERLQEMMTSVQEAQSRSTSVMASVSTLRQLGSAHVKAQDVETQLGIREGAGQITPNPTGSSFDKLLGQLSSASERSNSPQAQDKARDLIHEAESIVRQMKEIAVKAQTGSAFDRESLQSALNLFTTQLKERELPVLGKSQSTRLSSLNDNESKEGQLVFSSAITRQLGQFTSAQSQGAVDQSVILGDGDLRIQPVGGELISVRGAQPQDDRFSVRDQLGSALAKARAINASTAKHGVTAIAGPTVLMSDRSIGATILEQESYLRINGVEVSGFSTQDGDADRSLMNAINAVSKETGVQATVGSGGRLRLMAIDGRNITVDAYGQANTLGFTSPGTGQAETRTVGGALTLSSRGFFTFSSSGLGGDVSRALGAVSSVPTSQSLQGLDIMSHRGSIDALSVIELALADLNTLQGLLKA